MAFGNISSFGTFFVAYYNNPLFQSFTTIMISFTMSARPYYQQQPVIPHAQYLCGCNDGIHGNNKEEGDDNYP